MQIDSMVVPSLILAFNCAIIAGYPLLALAALVSLRRRGLTGSAQAVWVLIIVAVPFLGALAYALMRPAPSPAR